MPSVRRCPLLRRFHCITGKGVSCIILSFTGAKSQPGAYFGEGLNKPIHLESVRCRGSERNLTECEKEKEGNSTRSGPDHSLDVGVKCSPGK